MTAFLRMGLSALAFATLVTGCATPERAASKMSFFVTSRGLGDGANFGGLAGADAHCQALAAAAGAGKRTWVAYLSTQGPGAVNAKDRIGRGPWYNANGVLIAKDVSSLHTVEVNINSDTALDEAGHIVPFAHLNAKGEMLKPEENPEPVQHDMLTGSQLDGTAFSDQEDRTCRNWTSNSQGSAMSGHHDRRGRPMPSPWNAAHPSIACSQESLVKSGGAGRFYCFAK